MAKRKGHAPEPRDRGIFVTMNGTEVLAINRGTERRHRDRWIVKTLLAELKREEKERDAKERERRQIGRLKSKGLL